MEKKGGEKVGEEGELKKRKEEGKLGDKNEGEEE